MTTVTRSVHFAVKRRQKRIVSCVAAKRPAGRIPRVSKLMALAIRFEGLLTAGEIQSQTELARLAHVTQPRMTQIMNLLHLAPDIQEQILHLPRVEKGRDPITERDLRAICAEVDWERQREMWDHVEFRSASQV